MYSAVNRWHTCNICFTPAVKNTIKSDHAKFTALKTLGILITIRECQWNRIKSHIKNRSPYSLFFYEKNITTAMILKAVKDDRFFGLLEVDIKTPDWLKKECNRLNFATIFDKISPEKSMLSDSMLKRCEDRGMKFPLNPQLTLVYNANNYLITSTMLQFYMKLGLIVTKLHYCVEYQKSRPLQKFIELSKLIVTLYTIKNILKLQKNEWMLQIVATTHCKIVIS